MANKKISDLDAAAAVDATTRIEISHPVASDSERSTFGGIMAGWSGGKTLVGGSDSGDSLTIQATIDSTEGWINVRNHRTKVGATAFTSGLSALLPAEGGGYTHDDTGAAWVVLSRNSLQQAALLFASNQEIKWEAGLISNGTSAGPYDHSLHFRNVTGAGGAEVPADALIIDYASLAPYTPTGIALGVGGLPSERLHVQGDGEVAWLQGVTLKSQLYSGQTENLLEFYDASGTLQLYLDSSFAWSSFPATADSGQLTVYDDTPTTGDSWLNIRAGAGQTSNLLSVRNNANAEHFIMTPSLALALGDPAVLVANDLDGVHTLGFTVGTPPTTSSSVSGYIYLKNIAANGGQGGKFFAVGDYGNTDGQSEHWLVTADSFGQTSAGAPYTNDGYVEMNISGVTFKVMTTAG